MMKPAIILALVASPAYAYNEIDFCREVADAAEIVMMSRQTGVPQSTMREAAPRLGVGDKLAVRIIGQAYDEPMFTTPEFVLRSVTRFKDRIENECFSALTK